MATTKHQTIDEYIEAFPLETQEVLQMLRALIHKEVSGATETISYDMPTFNHNGSYLVYFAGYKKHIGFYPAPIGVAEFENELSAYKTGRGSVQFPLNKPMPIDLITRIVQYRLKKNNEKSGQAPIG
jgi:uncharacterized protein YdhG (YjbR/CyaY superfamily)